MLPTSGATPRIFMIPYAVKIVCLVLVFGALLSSKGLPAHASHFRFTTISWVPQPGGGTGIQFTILSSWRRSGYFDCVALTTPLTTIPCSAADGFPAVGDIILEDIGGTTFQVCDNTVSPCDPGDVKSIGSPLLYRVTSIDPVNDWLLGFALDPNSLLAVGQRWVTGYLYGSGIRPGGRSKRDLKWWVYQLVPP